jgi:hypothetical protein
MRVPVAPSTQGHQVRGLIRPSVLRTYKVVDDEAGGLPAFGAAVAVSLLHPRRRLLPSALVERGAGGTRAPYPRVLGTRERASAVAETRISHLGPRSLSFAPGRDGRHNLDMLGRQPWRQPPLRCMQGHNLPGW